MKSSVTAQRSWKLRIGLYIIIAGLLIWLIVRNQAGFQAAWHDMRHASPWWLVLAAVSMMLSLPATALVYRALSPRPLKFWRTVLVQTAGFCVNKLLPSGSGAAGVSFLYLRANRLPNVAAGALVVVNNLLGFVGHFVLFWLLVALQPGVLTKLQLGGRADGGWWALAVLLVVAAVALLVLRGKFLVLWWRFMRQLRPLIRSKPRFGWALGYSMLITLCYTLTLWASARAVGGHITLSAAIIALSTSVLATTAIPSPGGIGAAELGAYGGLTAVGVPHDTALAAALLYRVCSFWLPLLIGSFALIVVTQRGYLAKPSR
jgi:uncharacterized membrane protein YbhN (UPF0104 family)